MPSPRIAKTLFDTLYRDDTRPEKESPPRRRLPNSPWRGFLVVNVKAKHTGLTLWGLTYSGGFSSTFRRAGILLAFKLESQETLKLRREDNHFFNIFLGFDQCCQFADTCVVFFGRHPLLLPRGGIQFYRTAGPLTRLRCVPRLAL